MLRYLLLDLDNTVYPETTGMERDILRRMNEYVARYLGMPQHEARELRRERVRKFGTTLEWLMAEEGFGDPEAYFAAVHPAGEEYCIDASPALGRILDSIDLPKAILTNSPREHAERVLRKLGAEGCFEAIYDIRFNELRGKPYREAFLRACRACGVAVEDTLFIDDLPKYVQGFVDLGGRAVLVDESGRHADTSFRKIHSLVELPDLIAEDRAAASQLSLF
jgi:putative hydrolase of the HAD superfamily